MCMVRGRSGLFYRGAENASGVEGGRWSRGRIRTEGAHRLIQDVYSCVLRAKFVTNFVLITVKTHMSTTQCGCENLFCSKKYLTRNVPLFGRSPYFF